MQCPKCKGEMERGWVPDRSYGVTLVEAWYPDRPKKSFWTRTKAPLAEGVLIRAFRCQNCGFLEFYADPEFKVE